MASFINSSVKKIATLRFESLPNRKPITAEVVRVGQVIVTNLGKGRISSNQVRNGLFYPKSARFDETIIGLHMLGVITKSERDAHMAESDEIRKAQSLRYSAERFEDAANTLGIKLTNAQRGRIERAKSST